MTVLAAMAGLIVAAGCGGPDADVEDDAAAGSETTPAPDAPGTGQLDDADIAAVVVAANSIDVRYGEIARERASDERVKQFAETMITDHTAVNRSAGELVARLGVTPTENDVSRSLESSAATTRESLLTKSGAEFDRAYIENEVAYHRAVLSALDETLIPGATNAELKQTLVGVRPAFQAHLDHAESLLAALGGA
jgi:putative membrane protein